MIILMGLIVQSFFRRDEFLAVTNVLLCAYSNIYGNYVRIKLKLILSKILLKVNEAQ